MNKKTFFGIPGISSGDPASRYVRSSSGRNTHGTLPPEVNRAATSTCMSPSSSPRGRAASPRNGDEAISSRGSFFPEYEFEQFEKKQKRHAKKTKSGVVYGTLGAIGGFFVGGPPGAVAGALLGGGGSWATSGKKDSNEALEAKPQKWKRTYQDPRTIEPPNERRVKFLLKWAHLKVDEGGNEDTILLMFDEVLTHLSPWAARAEEQPAEATRMISLFGKFMNTPKVYMHFRLANRAWLSAWELEEVDIDDAYHRFVYILPMLSRMRDIVQPSGHVTPRICSGTVARNSISSNSKSTYRSLDHIKDWVDDTLDRTSVKTFINTYREQRLGAPPSPPIVRRRSSAGVEDTAIELPPEGAENEMEEGTALDYDSDEFFDAVEDPAMRSASILLDDYQKSTGAPDEEHRWGDSDHDWKVRGKKYLKDKVKVSSAPPTATLLAVDLAHSGGPDILQMTAQPQSAYECTRRSGNTEFLIVVNWRCPPMHVVNVFGMKDPQSDCLFQRFLKMDKEERNQRLKVVPFCPEGPWLARTAIGSTPVIIGNKIETTYFDGPDYLEISINVFSSSAAKRMMNVVCGVAKKMVIDVALLVEGRREDELPERVLGAFRVIRSDITKMRQLDTN